MFGVCFVIACINNGVCDEYSCFCAFVSVFLF